MLSKYTVKYAKRGNAKYISHLDFLRTIGRAMRRAELPLKYSEGFNPHPLISFAAPLSVGIESECELFRAELTVEIPCEQFRDRLNAALTPELYILDVTEENIDFIAIAAADYVIEAEFPPTADELDAFMSNDEILIEKKTKKGIKETDIKADIFSISVNDNIITAALKTGDSGNLKPMLLVLAAEKYLGRDFGFCRYKRLAFRDADNNVI